MPPKFKKKKSQEMPEEVPVGSEVKPFKKGMPAQVKAKGKETGKEVEEDVKGKKSKGKKKRKFFESFKQK